MRHQITLCLALCCLIVTCLTTNAAAQSAGWQATFSNDFHDVSGTATVVDQDTLLFDNFTFDGGGITVYFYLGEDDSTEAFNNGLEIGNNLVGPAFDGTQPAFTVDLPAGETIDGHSAISVWCTAVGVSFGSGTFQPQAVPEPSSMALLGGTMLAGWLRRRR